MGSMAQHAPSIFVAVLSGLLVFRSLVSLLQGIAVLNLLLTVFFPDGNLIVHLALWRCVDLGSTLATSEAARATLSTLLKLGDGALWAAWTATKATYVALVLSPAMVEAQQP